MKKRGDERKGAKSSSFTKEVKTEEELSYLGLDLTRPRQREQGVDDSRGGKGNWRRRIALSPF